MTVDPDEFRHALKKFASGVTVVTVGGDELHGMTASSFASVSLAPPLILVCLDKSSRTRSLIMESGSFAVNVLGGDQEEVSRSFAKRGSKPFAMLAHHIGTTGHPLLDESIAWIECNVHQVVEGGDHDIVIGEVIGCDAREGSPLVYFDQEYRSLRDF
ncbi:MAG: flavin reductase family protein [Actinomycetota bacterium]|nr:flavin reductase family protein [Actinomycetota bacterium]